MDKDPRDSKDQPLPYGAELFRDVTAEDIGDLACSRRIESGVIDDHIVPTFDLPYGTFTEMPTFGDGSQN